MNPTTGYLAFIYLLNSLLLFLLLKGFTRVSWLEQRSFLRIAILSIVVISDLAFLLFLDCTYRPFLTFVIVLCLTSISFPENRTHELSRALGRYKFGIYIFSTLTLVSLVYLYLPITVFLTSPGDIGIHMNYLIQNNLHSVMVILLLSGALYSFAFSPRMKSLLSSGSLVALSLGLIYSYIYPFGYPMMNGLVFEKIPISRSDLVFRSLLDIITVIFSVSSIVWCLKRFGGKRVLTGIVVVHISLATAAAVSIIRDATPQKKEQKGIEDVFSPLTYSKTHPNVLILFLDRFMGGFVERILADEPNLPEMLDGFVWFPRTVAAGENSIAGIHPLLGGYDYTPQEINKRGKPLRDVCAESYAILPYNFSKNGYSVHFVNPSGLGFTLDGDCSFLEIDGVHCTHTPARIAQNLAEQRGIPLNVLAQSSYANLLVLLGSMRSVPYVFRAVLHERGPWQPFLDHSAGTTFKEWAELKSLAQMSRTDSQTPNLNILFNNLPHEPYFLDEECQPSLAPIEISDEEARRIGFSSSFAVQHYLGARCSLRLVANYLNWLKKEGVYENTKIIIVSDHGIVGPVLDHSSRAIKGNTVASDFVRSRSVLFVKEANAQGPIRVSEEFLPNAEVPRIACEEIDGCINPFIRNKTIESHGRKKPWIVSFVPWQYSLQEKTRFVIENQMVLDGENPYESRAWLLLKRKR